MVGYLTDRVQQKYMPGTLGFWHNACTSKHDAFFNGHHIVDFKKLIPQELHMWLYDGIDPKDVGVMALRCFEPGYDVVYRNYKEARNLGIIEPNLPEPGLHSHEVASMLQWLRGQGRI